MIGVGVTKGRGPRWLASVALAALSVVADFNGDRYALPAWGAELVTNGTFGTNVSGWTVAFDGTLSHSSGAVRVTSNGGTFAPRALQTLASMRPGALYELRARVVGQSAPTGTQVFVTASSNGSTAGLIGGDPTAASTGARTITQYFTATAATLYLVLMHNNNALNSWSEFDDVSIREVVLDRPDTALGPELIRNGGFDTDLSGWTVAGTNATNTITVVGGVATFTSDGTGGGTALDLAIATKPGSTYVIGAGMTGPSGQGTLAVGTSSAGTQLGAASTTGSAIAPSLTFVATGTTTFVRLFKNVTAGTVTFDNVSCREIIPAGTFGPNLITNGTFDSGIAPWSVSGATAANVGGELEVTWNAGHAFPVALQNFTAVPGRTYEIACRARRGTTTSPYSITVTGGVSTHIIAGGVTSQTMTQHRAYIVATGAALTFRIYAETASAVAGTIFLDDVVIREVTQGVQPLPKRAATFDEVFSFTSARSVPSAATYIDAGGILRTVDYGRVNMQTNTTAAGAVTGSPGSTPTNWEAPTSAFGLPRQVLGTRVVDGITQFGVRYAGTATSGGNMDLRPGSAPGSILAAPGQDWAASIYVTREVVQGTTTPSMQYFVGEINNASAFVAGGGTAMTPTATMARYSTVRRVSNAATVAIYATLSINIVNGQTYDFTVWYGGAQTEPGTEATAFKENPSTTSSLVLGANVPRWTWVNGKRQLRLEDARTNAIRNNTLVGTVPGTPGASPNLWSITAPSGLTRTLSLETINGMPFLRVRFAGTTTASTTFGIQPEASNTITAAQNQTWVGSVYFQMINSTGLTGNVLNEVWNFEASGTFLGTGSAGTPGVYDASRRDLARLSTVRTLPDATTSFIRANLRNGTSIPSGTVCDIEFRIALSQLELGAFASDPIPTMGSAVTRAQESLRFSPLVEAIFQRDEFTDLFRGQGVQQVTAPIIGGNNRMPGTNVNLTALTGEGIDVTGQSAATFMAPFGVALSQRFTNAIRTVAMNGVSATNDAGTATSNSRAQVFVGRHATSNVTHLHADLVGVSPERLVGAPINQIAVAA